MKSVILTLKSLLILLLLASVISCSEDKTTPIQDNNIPNYIGKGASEFDSKPVQEWMQVQLYLTQRNRGCTPMVAARFYGYTSLALYEAVCNGSVENRSLAGQLQGLSALPTTDKTKEYHWGLIAHSALSKITERFYLNEYALDTVRKLHKNLSDKWFNTYKSEVSQSIYDNSVAYGNLIAEKIWEYSKTDGQEFCWKDENNYPDSYEPPTGNGKWVGARYFVRAMQPFWGNLRTFYPNNAIMTQPEPPNPYSEDRASIFFKEAIAVYTIDTVINNEQAGGKVSDKNVIGQYWNDEPYRTGTPAGHSVSVARHLITKERFNLLKASETYARVGMAIHDAFVSCWKAKYFYNTIRPITYLRANVLGNFNPKIGTPPFPEYTSGHSTQTGAMAEVLTQIFGDNYSFVDSTHHIARFDLPDVVVLPRTFNSIYATAEECSISRFYGGIHFMQALTEGVRCGKMAGNNVMKLKMKKNA